MDSASRNSLVFRIVISDNPAVESGLIGGKCDAWSAHEASFIRVENQMFTWHL
jgi:hypothetical protein